MTQRSDGPITLAKVSFAMVLEMRLPAGLVVVQAVDKAGETVWAAMASATVGGMQAMLASSTTIASKFIIGSRDHHPRSSCFHGNHVKG